MDVIKACRLLAASLLVLAGIIHFIPPPAGIEVTIWFLFGPLFVAIGIGLFVGKRLFNYLGVVVPLIGTLLGTLLLTMKPELILLGLPLIAINIIVILCCCYLILHKTQS